MSKSTVNSPEYTRSLIELSFDPLVTIAPDGVISDVNQAAEQVIGLSRTKLIGTDFSSYFTNPKLARAGYLQVYEKGSVRDYPLELRHINGHITPVLYNASVYKDKLGKVAGVFAVSRDISQQRSAEQQVKQVGEYTRSLIEASLDPLVTISAEGKIMDVNNATEKVTGIDRVSLIGSDFSNYFTEPDKARAGYQKVFTEGYVTDYPLSIRRKDGVVTHVLYNASVYRDEMGVPQGVFAAARDITEQKKAEERVAKIARYESTHSKVLTEFNSSQDRKTVLTQLLNILAESHNYIMSAFYGFDEWSGLLTCEARYGLNESVKHSYQLGEGLIGQCAKNNKKIVLNDINDDEYVIDVGFTKIKPKTVIITPVIYQEKRLGVFLMVSRDTASTGELIFIERLCVQTGVALHNLKQYDDMKIITEKLRDRNNEIELKNKQLAEASKMKSDFLANMSHELRTPLNAILGFSEAMKDKMIGEVNKKQEEGLNIIYESGQHLLSLINDILDLSKIEAGKMELYCTDLDINGVVERSLSIIKEKANKHNIHLNISLDPQLSKIYADERKVKQILFNLLSNATKFTPDSGSITISTQLHINTVPTYNLKNKKRSDYASITIKDTGIGIKPTDIERLFTPFEQLDGSFAKKYQGTGLGLALVKRLVELHGGCVDVQSEDGKGSTFTVWLPSNSTPTSIEDNVNQFLVKRKRVLLFNHNDADAAMIRSILEASEIEVLRSSNSETSALENQVAKHKIDAIIAEVTEPELERLQGIPCLSDPDHPLPLILIQVSDFDITGIAIKPRGIINKPISKNMLLRSVVSAGIPVDIAQFTKDYTVLIVDDDPNSINLISTYLQHNQIDLQKAYSGEQAITQLKEFTPDLIILDLMMPNMTGFDVLAYMQSHQLHEVPVVIVTAKIITPDDLKRLSGLVSNVIEKFDIDQHGFVDYINKLLRQHDAN